MPTAPILQNRLDSAQREQARRPLPGMRPNDGPNWITVDDAYSDQLAQKASLLKTQPQNVLRCLPTSNDATREVLREVTALLENRDDFSVRSDTIQRPDGVEVKVDPYAPLLTLSQLIQEDICILQKQEDEHVLTAALLCFPASWTLAEKIGKPLTAIHTPVPEYDANIAKRVQRLFDGVRIGQPMWRANFLNYSDPTLYHPRTEDEPRTDDHNNHTYQRSERQTVWRLPKTRAVVFAIHTTVTAPENEKGPSNS